MVAHVPVSEALAPCEGHLCLPAPLGMCPDSSGRWEGWEAATHGFQTQVSMGAGEDRKPRGGGSCDFHPTAYSKELMGPWL